MSRQCLHGTVSQSRQLLKVITVSIYAGLHFDIDSQGRRYSCMIPGLYHSEVVTDCARKGTGGLYGELAVMGTGRCQGLINLMLLHTQEDQGHILTRSNTIMPTRVGAARGLPKFFAE